MLGTIRIFGRRLFAQADFLCLQARIGRCCRLSLAIRSSAAPSSTAFYWELLEQERSLVPLPCRGSSAILDPTGRSRSGRQGPSSRSFCLPWRGTGRLRSAEASSLAGHGLVLATINVSAQLALPGWVRGRGLSIFGTVMFGSLTIGSAIW